MKMIHGMRAATLAAAVALALVGPAITPAAAAPVAASPVASNEHGTVTSQVTGTFTDASGGAGTFTGTFTPSRFNDAGDAITVDGLLAGQLVDSQGQSQAVSQDQTFTVQQAVSQEPAFAVQQVTCEVLDLDLGPLELDLLGLVVNLNEILLNITAVPGAGNLLGNLLCAVVGLLDGVGTIAQIVGLLNQILALLGLLGGGVTPPATS